MEDVDEYVFEDEYNVFERASYMERDVLGEMGIVYERRKKEDIRDPVQRFYIYVDSIARKLIRDRIITIRSSDVQTLLGYIARVSEPKYKNPTAFVLGYELTRSGAIDVAKLDFVKTKLKDLDVPIKVEDLIRYSNLWLRIK